MIAVRGYFSCRAVSQSAFQVAGSVTASRGMSVISLKNSGCMIPVHGVKVGASSGSHRQYYVSMRWEGAVGIHDGKSV